MKKIMMPFATAVILLGTVVQASAQSGVSVDTDPPPPSDGGPGVSSFTLSAAQQAVVAGTYILGKNFTIAPGRYADFKLPINYSLEFSSQVALSIQSNYGLPGTFIVPYFAAPGAVYTAADVIDCSQFPFFTQGGEAVPVYGTYLVVRVYNLSPQPVLYRQLMAHWSGR